MLATVDFKIFIVAVSSLNIRIKNKIIILLPVLCGVSYSEGLGELSIEVNCVWM